MVQSRKKEAVINREYFCAFLTQKKLRAYAFKYAASGIAAELHLAESPMPYKVTSSQWRQLQPYVTSRARRGRPPADARKTLEAVVYVLSSGCRWDELPAGMGSHITAWRRWRKWKEDGTMDIIQAVIPVPLSAPPKSRV